MQEKFVVRCPSCSSENLIPVNWYFLYNVLRVKVFKKAPIPERSSKRPLSGRRVYFFCLDCRKHFTGYDW